MNETNISASTCRFCRFYQPEGRRGGACQMLGVPVESSWKACALAASPFKTTLKKLEDIFQLETSPKNRANAEASKMQVRELTSPEISELSESK